MLTTKLKLPFVIYIERQRAPGLESLKRERRPANKIREGSEATHGNDDGGI